MNTLDGLNTFFGWLGRTSLQAAVLALIILAVQALVRDRIAPRWRHALWFLLLVRLLLPWAPQHRLSVWNMFEPLGRMATVSPAVPASTLPTPFAGDGPSGRSGLRPDSGSATAPAISSAPVVQVASERASLWQRVGSKTRPATLIAGFWLVGFGFFIGAAVYQSFAFGRAMRGRRPVTDQKLLELLESCKDAIGFHGWLMVIETPDVKSPALFGFIRPKLLIPQGAIEDLGLERLRHVFLHELAHLKRRDVLNNWISTLLLAAHWFNPLIWYAFHRMRADQELACDHLALSSIRPNESRDYGRTIIHLLEKFSQPARMPGLAGILEDQAQMKRRISMIAKFKIPSRKWSAVALGLMLTIGCVALTDAQTQKRSGVELKITDFRITPYEAGGLHSLVVSIANTGSKKSIEVRAYFYRNGEKMGGSAGIGQIEPGKTFHEATLPFAIKDGATEFKVVVDPENTIAKKTELTATLKVLVKDGKMQAAPIAEEFKVETTTDAEGRYVDKIDYPFVNDPRVIGRWESVDFLNDPSKFDPAVKSRNGDLFLKEITFFPNGKTKEWWTWTNGLLLHDGDKTASRYEIKQIRGHNYMFIEWKSGDYTIRHQKPLYYVLRQTSSKVTAADEPKRIVDKIDYPFVNDPTVVGRWGVVDYVQQTQQFKPGERQFKGASMVRMYAFQEGGSVSLMTNKDESMRKAPWYRWTKGILLHQGGDHTASHYEIKRIGDKTYMFLEHKSGDYILRGQKPPYWVLEKM